MSEALQGLIANEIRAGGPIGVDRFMALALGHPLHGYYVTRDPLGATGDFTTAPEISQMFGELIGLWCVSVWLSLGSPERFGLVELGPGRGTLMADLLRAARIVPGFGAAAAVHLVETSPVLRARQAAVLGATGVEPTWHAGLDTLPGEMPLIVVANEFFDALPIRQWVRAGARWHERMVGLDEAGAFAFGLAPLPDTAIGAPAPDGTVLEIGFTARSAMAALAGRVVAQAGALLAIDYGHVNSRFGETLQAVRHHAKADPLCAPGDVDLTAHVDFAALATAARTAGALVHGPARQGAFLRALGLEARAAALARGRADQTGALAAAVSRLADPHPGMGELFKVLAATSPAMTVPGFAGGGA